MSIAYISETAKNRQHTVRYCKGNGVDIGSGGDPVVPWAISLDLPLKEYASYNSGQEHRGVINWRGEAQDLPFKENTLDFVYSSHLLEDYFYWGPLLSEWDRVLKTGGRMIILLPDRERFAQAVLRGQPPNCNHKHEARVGELTSYMEVSYAILEDRLVNNTPDDYNLLFVGKKL